MSDLQNQIFEMMRQHSPEGMFEKLILPPPVFVEMGGEFIDFDMEAKTLTTRFPVYDRFRNPLGYLQGGVLGVLIDNTIGPLSFMIAPPNVTIALNISYLRPVTPKDQVVNVTARMIERTSRQLFLTGTATSASGKTFAIANASHQIID